MYPSIFGFIDSYTLMIVIGVILAFITLNIYANIKKINKGYFYSLEIVFCCAILFGFLGALGVQKLIDLINNNFSRDFPMTFYGGLLFGIIFFFLGYFFYLKKKYPNEKLTNIFVIAPGCITLAHCFGRIGCFLAGCCYGIETDQWYGIKFVGHSTAVVPTQLYEAIFLLILTIVLLLLAFKFTFEYNIVVYLASYGIWRFIIEFFRGDDRGKYFLNLSPGQWFSILALIGAIALFLIIFLNNKKSPKIC
jgi:phosphatidylglycerol:prolipoprotein diacylglycerol transferase